MFFCWIKNGFFVHAVRLAQFYLNFLESCFGLSEDKRGMENQTTHVLITGGTGLVGARLCSELCLRGVQVTLITRSPTPPTSPSSLAKFLSWNEVKESSRTLITQKIDAVFHLAGEPVAQGRWTSERKKRILSSRVQSTKDLMQALHTLPENLKPKRWINASAIGYFGDRGDETLTPDTPPGEDFLAQVCKEWEASAFNSDFLPQTTRSVVRIGMVLSQSGGALAKMTPIFQSFLGGPIGAGTHWMSWIHEADLTQLFLSLLSEPQTQPIYHAVSPNPVRNKEFTHALAKALNVPARLPVPKFALKLLFGEMSSILTASQRVLPVVPKNFEFQFPEIKAALQDLY